MHGIIAYFYFYYIFLIAGLINYYLLYFFDRLNI